MTITDEQLEQKEREVAELIGIREGGGSGASEESQERIDRILRRIRLESRIQEEAEAAIQGKAFSAANESETPIE